MQSNNSNSKLVIDHRLAKEAQSSTQDPAPAQPPAPSSPQINPAPSSDLTTTAAPAQKKGKNKRNKNRKAAKKKLQNANTTDTPMDFMTDTQHDLNLHSVYNLLNPATITKQDALENLAQVLIACNQQPHPLLAVAYNILGIVYRQLGKTENSVSLLQEALTYHHKALEIDAPIAELFPMYLQTAAITYHYIAMVNKDLANLTDALYHENMRSTVSAEPTAESVLVSAYLNFQQPPIKIEQENNTVFQSKKALGHQGIFGRQNLRLVESNKTHLTESAAHSSRNSR